LTRWLSHNAKIMQEHLSALDERVNNGASIKAEKEAAVETAKTALATATAKKEACIEAMKFAEEVCKGAVIQEKDAKRQVDQKSAALAKAKGKHAVEESGLEKAQKVLAAYDYLKDRVAAQEEAKEEDEEGGEKEEPPASPSRLATIGSAVTGLFFAKPEPKEE